MQSMTPQSVDAYKTWAKSMTLPAVVEDLADDTRIVWIGPKRTDNVILCIHGMSIVLAPTEVSRGNADHRHQCQLSWIFN